MKQLLQGFAQIAALIVAAKADYVLALKGNQGTLTQDVALFFDVTFREDACRIRKDHAARNLVMIRRAALNMLRKVPEKNPSNENGPKLSSMSNIAATSSHVNDS